MSLVIHRSGTVDRQRQPVARALSVVTSRLWWLCPAFLGLMALWAIFPDFFAPMEPGAMNPRHRLLGPFDTSPEGRHLAGTGTLGADLFSEMVAGARLTLFIAVVATAIGTVVGVLIGMLAGYFQGWVDRFLMRLTEAQTAMPMFLVAILLLSMLGPSVTILIIVLPALVWPIFARVVRAETMRVRESTYIEAAVATGCATPTVLVRHVLPNVTPRILVLVVIEVGHVMLAEAGLSFLGVGVQPPDTTWGLLISTGRPLLTVAWWLTILPGVLLGVTVLCLNLLARRFETRAGAAG
ncbi:MAG TPA: ABC transporter permease [Ilumatobacter sp.]|nr:ABC transporter permease [Ilumatobacter sp.]